MMEKDKQNLPKETTSEEQPEVFAIQRDESGMQFTRRKFIELAGAATAGAALVATPTPTPTPTPLSTTCTVRTNRTDVPVHVGPGTNRGILRFMPADQDIPVIGRSPDKDGNLWWQIDLPKVAQAWVADDNVTASGGCTEVGRVSTPPIMTAQPHGTATPTSTNAPTGVPGTVPPGENGINYTLHGVTFTQPCGLPIPPGAVCVCNCVSEPGPPTYCSCNTVCTCDTVCGCVGDTGHYWYPN